MAFEELKRRHGEMWGSAPFEKIAETAAPIHDELVAALGPQPGEKWLDVACGTGAVAFRAARAGADVTGIDFAPALVETARRLAREEGLDVRLEVGDAESLPCEDASFDVVSSSFGVMFAPDHRRAAGELARVCKPGGRLGLTTWDPASGIGEMFRTLAPFQPPPPEGAGNPLEWGNEDHLRALLGDAFEVEFRVLDHALEAESSEAAWELFRTSFGPVKTTWESLEGERREEYRRAFIELHDRYRENGGVKMERKYVLTLGRRR